MSVSIIIPAWNESKSLKAAVQSLLDVDYDRKKCEVIVVAGGDDSTYEIAMGLSTRMGAFSRYVIVSQRRQRTKNAAIQRGFREANNDIIVLLDADTVVSDVWLRNMVDPIEKGICELTIASSEPIRKNWISDYYMVVKTYFVDSITTYPGHSIAFKKSIVQNQTEYFFDETIWMGDDYLFERRVSEQGHKTMFIKDANVKTHYPCSLRYFWEIEFRWMMASIHMNGANSTTLTYNTIVVGSLMSLMPFSKTLFTLSLLFHTLYLAKRAHMFLVASRRYETKMTRIFGFIMLSYFHHMISFLSHIWYFLGLRKDTYYQGERF